MKFVLESSAEISRQVSVFFYIVRYSDELYLSTFAHVRLRAHHEQNSLYVRVLVSSSGVFGVFLLLGYGAPSLYDWHQMFLYIVVLFNSPAPITR
jgi:hypothetical protein